MKKISLFLSGILLWGLSSCDSYVDEYIEVKKFPDYSWTAAADSSTTAFFERYWNTTSHCFNNTFAGEVAWTDYWPEAHGLDVLVDAYLRTNDDTYKQAIYDFYEGVRAKNWYNGGGTWENEYYDDMGWHGLAHMRALEATGDERYAQSSKELWNWITLGWSDYEGGGIQWRKGADAEGLSKGIPANGPAAIIAARRYQKYPDEVVNGYNDLEWAKRIYDWMKYNRTVLSTGRVYENYDNTNNDYSYDVGTFLGAALELYNITGEKVYFNDAIKVTDYHIGKYGQMRHDFLKKHCRGTYTSLLVAFKLNAHLAEVDQEARIQVQILTAELAKQRGINEKLKATDLIRWAQEMNNCKFSAEETVLRQVICQ